MLSLAKESAPCDLVLLLLLQDEMPLEAETGERASLLFSQTLERRDRQHERDLCVRLLENLFNIDQLCVVFIV